MGAVGEEGPTAETRRDAIEAPAGQVTSHPGAVGASAAVPPLAAYARPRRRFFAAIAQLTSLGIRVDAAAASDLLSQDGILCEEVLGDALLVTAHPAGDGQLQELKRQARHRPILALAVQDGKPHGFKAILAWHRTGFTQMREQAL